jgi:hypothetical protein
MPVWIDNWRVDSCAMLSAYLATPQLEEQPYYGQLFMKVHDSDFQHLLVHPRAVRVLKCQEVACTRCINRKGGYVFRWYHSSWEDNYIRYARNHPEVWMPPGRERTEPQPAGFALQPA